MKKLAAVMCGLSWMVGVHGESVQGQFLIGGKKVAIAKVSAFRTRDGLNARNFETLVLLTPVAINADAIKNELDPYVAAINDLDLNDTDYVQFSVQADDVVRMNAKIGGVQYLDTSGKMVGWVGSLKATCSVNTAEHVTCEVATLKPIKSMDGPTWETKFSFDAPVLSRARGGAIAAGGGEAGKALLALFAAHKAKNKTALLAQLSAEDAADYSADWRTPEENLKALVERFDWSLPKKPKIISGEQVDAQTVLLEVEGVPYDNVKMLYLVKMHKVDGNWRFDSNTTLGMLR
jgi:hypothetical protein